MENMFKREFIAVDEWLKDANLINVSYGLNKLDFSLLSYINEKNERLFSPIQFFNYFT